MYQEGGKKKRKEKETGLQELCETQQSLVFSFTMSRNAYLNLIKLLYSL